MKKFIVLSAVSSFFVPALITAASHENLPGATKFMASAIGTTVCGAATYYLFKPAVKSTSLAIAGLIGGGVGSAITGDSAPAIIMGGLCLLPAAIIVPTTIVTGALTYYCAQPMWRTFKHFTKRS